MGIGPLVSDTEGARHPAGVRHRRPLRTTTPATSTGSDIGDLYGVRHRRPLRGQAPATSAGVRHRVQVPTPWVNQDQYRPCCRIASATLTKPAMLAPSR